MATESQRPADVVDSGYIRLRFSQPGLQRPGTFPFYGQVLPSPAESVNGWRPVEARRDTLKMSRIDIKTLEQAYAQRR